MTASDKISIVSACISAIAVIVSAVAVVLGRRANTKANRNADQANEIQEQLLEIEQQRDQERLAQHQRASVIPELVSDLSPNKHILLKLGLVNGGNSSASNIAVSLDGRSIADIGWIAKPKPLHEIILGAGASYRWHIHNDMRSDYHPPPWNVVVTWDNESGERGEYRTTLTR